MTKDNKELRDIDRPFYRYWQAWYHSFFNPLLYIDVGKRWKGFGVLYFLLLMLIVTIPFYLRTAINFNQFFNEDLIQPLEQLPAVYIQNGIVSFDKPMPYFIKNKKNQIVSIIDTTGAVTTINETYPHLQSLITKDKFFYHFPTPHFFFAETDKTKADMPVNVYTFDKNTNTVFVGKEWVKASKLRHLKIFFTVLLYPMIAFMFFSLFLTIFLAVALMGQLVAYLLKFPVGYKQACRLLLVSITPSMIILWVLMALNWVPAGLGIILSALGALYFCFALLSLKRESQKLVIQ
ncbi:DUF1189 family protein [Legionella fairfieldensis]|uniref:DUF1189 family protein n=1 Tax=Legionella fairfieldensis TaxID=45064 RepID=UPI00049066E5|nr:DUF1189 family protein [Legionella fairfieldensis]